MYCKIASALEPATPLAAAAAPACIRHIHCDDAFVALLILQLCSYRFHAKMSSQIHTLDLRAPTEASYLLTKTLNRSALLNLASRCFLALHSPCHNAFSVTQAACSSLVLNHFRSAAVTDFQ